MPGKGQGFTQTIGGMNAQDGLGAWTAANGYHIAVREATGLADAYRAGIYSMNNSGGLVSSFLLDSVGLFLQQVVNATGGTAFAVGSMVRGMPAHHDAAVMKLAQDGSIIWRRSPSATGSQQLLGGFAMPDGGVLACGLSTSMGGHDALVQRYGPDGTLAWSFTGNDAYDAEAHALACSGDVIMVTGRQTTSSGQEDILVMRMDLDGDLIWTSSLGGQDSDVGRAIVAGSAPSSFTIAGWTNSFGIMDQSSQRTPYGGYLLELDLNGDTLWTRTLGDTLFDQRFLAMKRAPNGDLFLAGERGTAGLSDAVLLRTGANGTQQWLRTLDLGKEERLTHLLPIANGVVATGWSFGPFGRQLLFIRRNDQGN